MFRGLCSMMACSVPTAWLQPLDVHAALEPHRQGLHAACKHTHTAGHNMTLLQGAHPRPVLTFTRQVCSACLPAATAVLYLLQRCRPLSLCLPRLRPCLPAPPPARTCVPQAHVHRQLLRQVVHLHAALVAATCCCCCCHGWRVARLLRECPLVS